MADSIQQYDLINNLIERRVKGEELGYGVLKLNPTELDYFERTSAEARRSGYFQRVENVTKSQQQAAKSGVGLASSNTGFIAPAPNFSSSTKGAIYISPQDATKQIQRQNVLAQQSTAAKDSSYALINPSSISKGSQSFPTNSTSGYITEIGAFSVTPQEAKNFSRDNQGSSIPFFVTGVGEAKNFQEAIDIGFTEGQVLGQTQVSTSGSSFFNQFGTRGQYEFNVANLSRAKDEVNFLRAFQSNPDEFVSKGLATSTKEGNVTSTSLNKDAFNQFYTPEANLNYLKQGRDSFLGLGGDAQRRLNVAGEISAITKAGQSGIEFGGSIAKTVVANSFVTNFGKSSDEGFFKSFQIGGRTASELRSIPAVQSVNPFYKVPGLGLEIPTTGAGFKEFRNRPEQVLNLVGTGIAIGNIAKLGTTGFKLYSTERALGASRLGALNTLGGEGLTNLGLISTRQRIFISETESLSPFKTTQLNKGVELSSIKIGESKSGDVYSITKAQSIQYSPSKIEYTSFKPGLTNSKFSVNSLELKDVQLISLRDNVFNIKQTAKDNEFRVTGKGQRDVFSYQEQVFQDTKYTLSKKSVFSNAVQDFESFGKGTIVDSGSGKKLAISLDKTTFANIERQTLYGKYTSFGKDYPATGLQEGRAFGKGISGRPTSSKGFGINVNLVKFDSDLGGVNYGKSISKYSGGGRKGVQVFTTKTSIPKSILFKQEVGGFETKISGPKLSKSNPSKGLGLDVLQSEELKQQLVKNTATNSLSPSITKLVSGLQKTDLGIGKGKYASGLITKTRLNLGSKLSNNQITSHISGIKSSNKFNQLSSNTSLSGISTRFNQRSNQGQLQGTAQISSLTNVSQLVNTPSFSSSTSKLDLTLRLPGTTSGIGGFPDTPSLGGFSQPQRKKRGKRSSFDIAPSFTAIIENIKTTSPIKVSKTYGLSGLESRGLFVGSRSKKEKYFKLTDL